MRLVPLENPLQVSAFDYGQVYSPQSPKFSRAMAVVEDADEVKRFLQHLGIATVFARARGPPERKPRWTQGQVASQHGERAGTCNP